MSIAAHSGAVIIIADLVAGLAVLGSISGYLDAHVSSIAAGMAIIYYLFMFGNWIAGRWRR
jgi:hypothetical protein